MQIDLTSEQKQILRTEFNNLNTIFEKFEFWETKFETPFILFLFLNSSYVRLAHPKDFDLTYTLQDFIIYPNSKEFYEYCKIFTEQYKAHFSSAKIKIDLLETEDLIAAFKEEMDNAILENIVIDSQLKQIENRVANTKFQSKLNPTDRSNFYLSLGYEKQLLKNQDPILNLEIYDYINLISYLNGTTIANFELFLKTQISRKNNKSEKDLSLKPLSIKQQLIALHLLGTLDIIRKANNAVKQSEFLSLLLCKSAQNIRDEFSSINELLTPTSSEKKKARKKDLQTVLNTFKIIGNTTIIESIEAMLLDLD